MAYLLRCMREEDIPSIIEGEKKAFGSSLGFDLIYSDFNLNPFSYYFVLEIDLLVRGCIYAWLSNDKFDIINFYVDEEYRSLGYGTIMLNFLIKLIKESGGNGISLEVRETNHKAIKFYEKFGFKYSRTRYNYYENKDNALVYILEV